jgi:hypothetical protein
MPTALITRATFGRPKDYKAPTVRTCRSCQTRLVSANPSSICAPCNGGNWEEGEAATEAQVLELRGERREEAMAA